MLCENVQICVASAESKAAVFLMNKHLYTQQDVTLCLHIDMHFIFQLQ